MMSSDSEPPAQPQSASAPPQNTTSPLQGRPAIPHASPASHPPPSHPSSTSNETSSPSGMPPITPPLAPASVQPRHKVIIREPNGTLLQFDNFQSDGRPTRVPRTGPALSPFEQDFAESLAREERERPKDKKTKARKGRKKGKGQGQQAQEEAKRKQAEDAKALKEDQGSQRAKCEEIVSAAEAFRKGVQERKVEPEEPAEEVDGTSPKEEVQKASLPAALFRPRAIGNINTIQYPKGIFKPSVRLNVHTKDNKFIYDRSFLLQFKDVCRERPGTTISADALKSLGIHPDCAVIHGASRRKAPRIKSPAATISTSNAGPEGASRSKNVSRTCERLRRSLLESQQACGASLEDAAGGQHAR